MSKKKEKVELFFTDEMHRKIFVFQDSMKSFAAGKVVMKPLRVKTSTNTKTKVR